MKIVGGSARGRILEAPPGRNTRPTSAVLREALFGILAQRVPGARVLDLFCGSGAIALEAISRGAKSAVMIDADAKAVQTAVKNTNALNMQAQCRVYRNDFERALRILQRKGERFDVVYVDPPYRAAVRTGAEGAFPGAGGGKRLCDFRAHRHDGHAARACAVPLGMDPGLRDAGDYDVYRGQ